MRNDGIPFHQNCSIGDEKEEEREEKRKDNM